MTVNSTRGVKPFSPYDMLHILLQNPKIPEIFIYIQSPHLTLPYIYIIYRKPVKKKHPRFYLSLSSSSILIFHCLSHPHELLTWRSPPRSCLSLSSSSFFTPLYSHITLHHTSHYHSHFPFHSLLKPNHLSLSLYPILQVSYLADNWVRYSLDYLGELGYTLFSIQ